MGGLGISLANCATDSGGGFMCVLRILSSARILHQNHDTFHQISRRIWVSFLIEPKTSSYIEMTEAKLWLMNDNHFECGTRPNAC